MKKSKLLVVVGPTASGKTSLSISLAKQFKGEIISADSRQVYRSLDIGTEKVTEKEMDGVQHHLIDVVDVGTVYSATDFKRDAEEVIRDCTNRGRLPIVAGGTFFYIDVLLGKAATADVEPNEELRDYLNDFNTEALYRQLETVDPVRASTIDKHNKRRLIRALEVVSAKGRVPQEADNDCPYDVLLLGIERSREELRARIRARAEAALTRGLVEETKDLLEQNVSAGRLSEIGLEYRLVLQYLNGELSDTELIQRLEEKVWQYAKRQLTWLKRDDAIRWVDPVDRERIFSTVETWLKK